MRKRRSNGWTRKEGCQGSGKVNTIYRTGVGVQFYILIYISCISYLCFAVPAISIGRAFIVLGTDFWCRKRLASIAVFRELSPAELETLGVTFGQPRHINTTRCSSRFTQYLCNWLRVGNGKGKYYRASTERKDKNLLLPLFFFTWLYLFQARIARRKQRTESWFAAYS